MLKYDFLSVHCFPQIFFIDPRDHINNCTDFGNVKRFQPKKTWTPELQTHPYYIYGDYFSHTTIG